jgi:hypothetical protein
MSVDDTKHSKGGKARAEKLSPEERREIASNAAKTRWAELSNLPMATHDGVLHIGDIEIPCAVLQDKRRVLTQSGMMQALGRARQAKGRQYYDGDVNLPAFLTAKNLKPFIPKELYVTSSQIEFRRKGGGKAFGYPAEILPKICAVFDEADTAGALTPSQKHIGAQARILIRGLAQVGIVALVDEATGYQEERDKDELHKLLAVYLSEERLAWAKRFPDEFYRQIYRLKGWAWPVGRAKTPLLGHITNDIVYDRLPPGVLDKLRELNPKDDGTKRRKWKHHQFLSDDVGQPDLRDHMLQIIPVMRLSRTWDAFIRNLNAAVPKPGSQIDMELGD